MEKSGDEVSSKVAPPGVGTRGAICWFAVAQQAVEVRERLGSRALARNSFRNDLHIVKAERRPATIKRGLGRGEGQLFRIFC